MTEPEDFDGHNDHDGCPETSEDSDGDTIVDVIDECPYEPEGRRSIPRRRRVSLADNDEDGILDLRDECPYAAEDMDGWYDEDGAPTPTTTRTAFPTAVTPARTSLGFAPKMAVQPSTVTETASVMQTTAAQTSPRRAMTTLTKTSCPDVAPSLVRVTRQRVLPKQNVQFRTGQAIIDAASFGLLNDILQVLRDAPEMRLRIEGHRLRGRCRQP